MTSPSEARTIDISPEEEAKTVALAFPDQARAVVVSDYATKEAANAFFLDCRRARKVIATFYDPKIEEWKAVKKQADDNRAKMVAEKAAAEAPIVEAEGIVNREIMRFDAEDRKRRDEELRIATEKQRKENEEAALRAAEEAEKAGDKEEADAILEEAEKTPVFVPPPQPPPKLTGTAEYTIWKARVVNLKALVLAIAAGRAPLTYVKADEVAVGATARAQKASFRCEGIEVYSETNRKATGR